jgi:hypothetical protein
MATKECNGRNEDTMPDGVRPQATKSHQKPPKATENENLRIPLTADGRRWTQMTGRRRGKLYRFFNQGSG